MSHLAIYLFGGFRAELDGQPLTTFGTDKNCALLAYLALESERPHRRESLAALLWPNHPEAEARSSLRQALYTMRHVIVKGPENVPHLLVTAKQVQFNPASDHWIDVVECKGRLSACRSHHPAGLGLCAGCLESLQCAIELYRGEMLEGFTFPTCTEFAGWQTYNQEACHRQALAALNFLADHYQTIGAYEQLIACTLKKIALEPWSESAHRRLMWALAMDGQREQALRQYETLHDILQRELGIQVADETRHLYEQIRDGILFPLSASQNATWQSLPPAAQSPAKGHTRLQVLRRSRTKRAPGIRKKRKSH